MSDNWDDNYGDDEYSDGPKALREAYENLKNKLKQVEADRDSFKGKWQSLAVGDVLTGQGFKNPERVKKGLLADKVDLSDKDAVTAWLAENGDDYARTAGDGNPTPTEGDAPDAGQMVDPNEVSARQQLQQAQTYTQPAAMDRMTAALADITPEMTGKDVEAVYKKHGVY